MGSIKPMHLLKKLIIFPFYLLSNILNADPLLILNVINKDNETLPANFRTTQDSFKLKNSLSRKGLEELDASASAQFCENELKAMVKNLKKPSLIIVDLREESHGFINGHAVSWYTPKNWGNASLDSRKIEEDEKKRLNELFKQNTIVIHIMLEKAIEYPIKPPHKIPISIQSCTTERGLCNLINISYFRLPIRDHSRPSDEQVDRFIYFLNSLAPHTWLHFHCSGGKGRATMLLTMYDIYKNGKTISLSEIIKRQHLLGGLSLATLPAKSSWKYAHHRERYHFIKQFYAFCRETSPQSPILWSQWVKNR